MSMRFVVLVPVVLAAAWPGSAGAQSSMARYEPSCDPLLSVPEIPALSVSGSEELGIDLVAEECVGSFMDKIDDFAKLAVDYQGFWESGVGMAGKAQATLKQLLKAGAGIEAYTAACIGTGLLKTSPTAQDAWKDLNRLVAAVGNVRQAVTTVAELRGASPDFSLVGNEGRIWSALVNAYDTGTLPAKIKGDLGKVYETYRGADYRARQALAEAQQAVQDCRVYEADRALKQAAAEAVSSLQSLRYSAARAKAILANKREKVAEYLEGRGWTHWNRYADGSRYAWETADAQVVLANLDRLSNVAVYGEWRDFLPVAEAAQTAVQPGTELLATIDLACTQLRDMDRDAGKLETVYLEALGSARSALTQGLCQLDLARDALRTLKEIETDRCAAMQALNASADIEQAIAVRSRDRDCGARAEELHWSGTAVGTCTTTYKGYEVDGHRVEPADPLTQRGRMTLTWSPELGLYEIEWGSQRIVGAPPSFDVSDECDQVPNPPQWVPGCWYRSRPTFRAKGHFEIGGDTVNVTTEGIEDRHFHIKYSSATCSYRRETR